MPGTDERMTDISALAAHPRNYNRHSAGQVADLARSLTRFGQRKPVVTWHGVILAGHGLVEAARSLGWSEIWTAEAPEEWTEAEALAFVAADNELARAADPDLDALAALVAEVGDVDAELARLAAGGEEALKQLLATLAAEGPGGDPGAALERAEALQAKYSVQRGQVWELGRHRLMCGDAYSAEDRKTILGDSMPSLLHIDPPYGINIVQPRNGATAAAIGGSKPFGGTSGTERKTGAAERRARAERGHVQHGKPSKNQLAQSNEYLVIKGDTALPTGTVGSANIVQSNLYPVIQGDDRPFDPAAFLGLAPVTIMWGGNYFADKLPASSCWIVWDKREDITRNTFADCELAWCNLAKPARLFHHLWNGLHKGSQHGERRTHPTEKPVALFEEIGRMFCPQGVWLDLFAGTGAQLMAAERLPDVRCFANEIEPIYVATILERWSVMTGRTPVLDGGVDG